ncbi:MAG: PPC domain-containing DNA-binding protein [Patescibacteria group bacterium]
MNSKKSNNKYILKLKKGEEVIETLTRFCEDNDVKSGSITGIGATDNATLNYFDLEKGDYIPKKFSGKNYEILSLNGNITLVKDKVKDKPFVHIHITLGDSDYNVFGGHLVSADISVTCEIIINVIDETIYRKMDEGFKLNFLDL